MMNLYFSVSYKTKTRARQAMLLLLSALMLLATMAGTALAAPGDTTRVSVDSNGVQANSSSFKPSISADGRYVAFTSNASNLVPNDTNGVQDIFVHERGSADTTPPQLTLPADSTKEATGPNGAVVNYNATATDENPASPQVTCSKNSGDTFPLGTTIVNCSATDAAGNKATGSFNVTVQDTTPPMISGMPANIDKTATRSSGTAVGYQQPTASDLVDGSVPVNCSPASDSTFALGSTTVNCSASDSRNNTSQKSFKVNVTYSWGGILQPINGGTTLGDYADDTSFKLGSTVPVKFQLSGASAGITNATAKLTVAKGANNVAGSEAEAGTTSAATTGNLFRYDATSGQYIFNWGTKGLTTGTYQLKIDLLDGTTNTVRVSLR